ncbi:glycosyltransferase family 2 protein [Palleronia sp. LCG004]|uniref:glycosyltransferase family 2 protein n=1 Tax=Palleronia sp. LCG004 TaxID=3079304 RepID=UPI002941DA95|nr:glycosyltransferase family 2 protein [Palleronia sp. LCG004]WOI57512.1 glycosyltransferase family 2 protein [Palleronia sp. LCG004]
MLDLTAPQEHSLRRRHPTGRKTRLGELLVEDGSITARDLEWALRRQRHHICTLGHVLTSNDLVSEHALYRALAKQKGAALFRATDVAASPPLVDRIGVDRCARLGILPIGRAGGTTIVATSQPFAFESHRDDLERLIGPVAMAVMPESDLRSTLTSLRRHSLAGHAETRVDLSDSCRTFGGRTPWIVAGGIGLALVLSFAFAPVASFAALAAIAVSMLLVNAIVLLYAMQIAKPPPQDIAADTLSLARLPRVSILVPLYREKEIAAKLIKRLSVLDYPAELLDVCLVVEESDAVTRATIARSTLPIWMRMIAVPEGAVRTKPRAMNYALDFCMGDVIGIYDAEDEPPADQILRVVRQFARSPAETGCLQGRLNFYNSTDTWLTRCFTVDYSTWFSLVLPAMHRLGWPIPLGGTTVFFRRSALEDVGGWDAHNVTEDADLGMRLARRGYRTDLLDSTTREEATMTPGAWISQRSRWLKGYAITWAVHMRDPGRLLRDLGPRRFLGFQVLFLANLLSVSLAPVLWSFWLLPLGLPHPLAHVFTGWPAIVTIVSLFAIGLIGFAANIQALLRERHGKLIPFVPLMHVYYPMATIAMAKAFWEILRKPFFWDKTQHGVTLPDNPVTQENARPHRA